MGVHLQAINTSGLTLHNVSLHLIVDTLDGSKCAQYYFIPEWQAEENPSNRHAQTLSLATEWRGVGASATTGVSVSMISDEFTVTVARFVLDDHIPTAVDRILGANDELLKRGQKFALVGRSLGDIDGKLATGSPQLDRLKAQRKRAKDLLDAKLGDIDKKLEDLRVKKVKMGDDGRAVRKEAWDKVGDQIKKLEAERDEWRTGKR